MRWRSGGSVRQLNKNQLADWGQVFASFHHKADTRPFRIASGLVDGLDYPLGKVALTGSLNRAVAQNEDNLEAAAKGPEMNDGALLEFEAQGPFVFGRDRFSLFFGDAVLDSHPVDQLLAGLKRGTES